MDANDILYVIKIGGNIIDDEEKLNGFFTEFARIESPYAAGAPVTRKILVHGGGKLATELAEKLHIPQKLVDGRRITDAETLKIVTMVYAGYINKTIVARLQSVGCNAFGLCGADGGMVVAHKRINPTIDYGFVGDIDSINVSLIDNLLRQGLTLVVAPITQNDEGQLLNTNADTVAQEIATALSHAYNVHLIYSFEKSGVLTDVNDESSVIPQLTWNDYQRMKSPDHGTGMPKINAGMIPKLDNAFSALEAGVKKITIGNAEKLAALISGESGTNVIHGS